MSSNTMSDDGDPTGALLDAVDAALNELMGTDPTCRTVTEQKQVLLRLQALINRLPALQYREIAALKQQASPADLGDTLQRALANLLRITVSEAKKLVDDAERLGPRTALDGQPLEPWLAVTAAAQAEGAIGAGHVAVIRDFMKELPGHISVADREQAEAKLVDKARTQRPDQVAKVGHDLHLELDQDGRPPTDQKPPRAPKGELHIGPQRKDGSRSIKGRLTAEAAATWKAINAKWAAPGACNPSDESACIDEITDDAARRDGRTQAQRNHDAFVAVGRAMLASGQLGKHHGLPATIIVSTTLRELMELAGLGVTAGGTRLKIADVLRMARHAHHYLVIYGDHGEVLHLGRTRRTASPSQQIVLYDRDRGCTFPGCTVPGYGCEAHHAVLDWANGGLTDVDELGYACPPHNKMVKEGGWTTRKNIFGDTEWIPPAHLDFGQTRTNDFHHPERLRHPRPTPPDTISANTPPATTGANTPPNTHSHNTSADHPPAEGDGDPPT